MTDKRLCSYGVKFSSAGNIYIESLLEFPLQSVSVLHKNSRMVGIFGLKLLKVLSSSTIYAQKLINNDVVDLGVIGNLRIYFHIVLKNTFSLFHMHVMEIWKS